MSIEKYLEEMKKIHENLLDYIDSETNIEEKYQNLKNIFEDIKIHNNQFEIKSLFYLIVKISNNHHRESGFFSKIEQILELFKDDMSKYFSNSELFHIFKSNKRLLLFLFEENIMIMDEYIVKKIIKNEKYLNAKYPQYFQPEIQPFLNKEWFPKCETNEKKEKNKWVADLKKELPSDFYENRKIGENDYGICKLIQKDLIEEFIIYVNKNCISVNSTINPSIYETNNFLLKQSKITLIEYAAFFGSIQIFDYLRNNGAKLDSSLWLYAIHGQNPEIINFLEENKILQSNNEQKLFEQIFKESIKCHHIDIINYIQNNYLQNKEEYLNDILIDCFKYYNFMFMKFDINNENLFFYLCKYDYYLLVLILYKKNDLDINKKIIYIFIFLFNF